MQYACIYTLSVEKILQAVRFNGGIRVVGITSSLNGVRWYYVELQCLIEFNVFSFKKKNGGCACVEFFVAYTNIGSSFLNKCIRITLLKAYEIINIIQL